MNRNVLAAVGVILLALSIYNGYEAWQNVQHRQQTTAETAQGSDVGVTVGHQAPPFTLESDKGEKVSVDKDDIGRIYVLNFWASWCPPCRAEMPDMEAFYQADQDKVAFYAINLEEPKEKAASFIQGQGYTFPLLFDVNGEVGHLFKVRDIPTTIVVDAKGVIRFRKSGATTRAELEKVLQSIEKG